MRLFIIKESYNRLWEGPITGGGRDLPVRLFIIKESFNRLGEGPTGEVNHYKGEL